MERFADEEAVQCLICLDEIDDIAAARMCGYCSKRVCASCLPHLCEITCEGELDEENGDLRCPNCRRSLVDGDLHWRRQAIVLARPDVPHATAADIVTLEDLICRVMQLCAREDTGVQYYSVSSDVVANAIARDPQYTALLERLLGSQRRARAFSLSLRREPINKENVTILCKEYMRLLVEQAGVSASQTRRILGASRRPCSGRWAGTSACACVRGNGLHAVPTRAPHRHPALGLSHMHNMHMLTEEIAEQGLNNALHYERYSSVWKPGETATKRKRDDNDPGDKKHAAARPLADSTRRSSRGR